MHKLFLLLIAVAVFAQQTPPSLKPTDAYAKAAALLEGADPAAPTSTSAARKPAKKKDPPEAVVQVERETPLPPNAIQALAMSKVALDMDPQPHQAADGTVVYTYGKGIPVIVCSLLRLTQINLEPGELLEKDGLDLANIDDFKVAARHAGTGPDAFSYIVVKPTRENTETTMTVGTDKRVYYLRLRSTGMQYMSRVAFSYPEEEAAAKKALAERDKAEAEERAKLAALAAPAEVKSWDYVVTTHGHDAHYLLPLAVGDDGVHTHIQFSQNVRVRGLPVLQIHDASGPIPANSHWEDNTLIVDALFEDGCLLQGVGKKQQSVCIHNKTLRQTGGSK